MRTRSDIYLTLKVWSFLKTCVHFPRCLPAFAVECNVFLTARKRVFCVFVCVLIYSFSKKYLAHTGNYLYLNSFLEIILG